jgi:hypothetical protein
VGGLSSSRHPLEILYNQSWKGEDPTCGIKPWLEADPAPKKLGVAWDSRSPVFPAPLLPQWPLPPCQPRAWFACAALITCPISSMRMCKVLRVYRRPDNGTSGPTWDGAVPGLPGSCWRSSRIAFFGFLAATVPTGPDGADCAAAAHDRIPAMRPKRERWKTTT